MSAEILVTYGTKTGSTMGVAQAIGEILQERGAQVTIVPISQVHELGRFDVVLVGGPIINGKCLAEVRKFIKAHQAVLSRKTVAYFITCMRLSQVVDGLPLDQSIVLDSAFGPPKPKREMTFPERSHPVTMYLKAIEGMAPDVSPISIGFFRGALDYGQIGFFMRLLFKFMERVDGLGPGDYRNWDEIKAWAAQVHTEIAVGLF
jgi:menaquinone-dependent protoporphyrinogen oxidase